MTSRTQHLLHLAILSALGCAALGSAHAQTVTTPTVDTTTLARLASAPPIDRAPGGLPVSQTTWCKVTGLGPTVKARPDSAVSYGPSIRLRTQIGPCSIEMPTR